MLSAKTLWAGLVLVVASSGAVRSQDAQPQLEPIPLPQEQLPRTATARATPSSAIAAPTVAERAPVESVDPMPSGDSLIIDPSIDQPPMIMDSPAPSVSPTIPAASAPIAVETYDHYSASSVAPPVVYHEAPTIVYRVVAPPVVHAARTVYYPRTGSYVMVSVAVPRPVFPPPGIHVVETMTPYPHGTVYRAHSHSVPIGAYEHHVQLPPPALPPVLLPGQPIRNAMRARWMP